MVLTMFTAKNLILFIVLWGGIVISITMIFTSTFVYQKVKNDSRNIYINNVNVIKATNGSRVTYTVDRKEKLIYMHKPAHWLIDWVGNSWETSNIFKTCPVSNCLLSKTKTSFDTSDVVMIRPSGLWKTCLKRRKVGQIWVFMEHESPPMFDPGHKRMRGCYRNMFNWTLTYRRDSDFTLVHGYFKPKPKKDRPDQRSPRRDIKSKTRNAVGFISNCYTSSQRGKFIRKLNATGLNVDIVGGCGNMKCSDGNRYKAVWNTTGVPTKCFDVLNTKYKFYLSFENALCVDYVTEKSLNLIMSRNILPVIRDGVNHSLYHPPKSYIHTSEFANVQNLAAYLLGVAQNETRYREYFNWREHYSIHGVIDILQKNFCDICQRSHNPDKYHRLYADVDKFVWNYAGKPACLEPTDLYS